MSYNLTTEINFHFRKQKKSCREVGLVRVEGPTLVQSCVSPKQFHSQILHSFLQISTYLFWDSFIIQVSSLCRNFHKNFPINRFIALVSILFFISHLQFSATFPCEGSPSGLVANMLDYYIIISKFKCQLCYCNYFWTNTLGKGMNPCYSRGNRLSSIIAVL